MTKTKILIADDEPNILMLMAIMLEDAGYEVVKARNGAEAIQLAAQECPDLIITDVIMPENDGFDVCRAVRANDKIADTPIIILSAMGDEYNKLTGFEGGADDYVTKPFNTEVLKARIQALLQRYQRVHAEDEATQEKPTKEASVVVNNTDEVDLIKSGLNVLDESLGGGLPKGSNILVMGPIGVGKSSISRAFIAEGLKNQEKSMFIAVDDAPDLIRRKITELLGKDISGYEESDLIRFIDAYSWSSGSVSDTEPYAINGVLDLNQLSGVISDAGADLGQTIQQKMGGRRVIDSISSLLVNFELSAAQRFLTQVARTSIAFGNVTTLFVLEEGTVSEQVLNNIKYVMDGVIEIKEVDDVRKLRVSNMKWIHYSKNWIEI
jgi:CheY-like chemotaxis protein/KaiC/GvpD/RAD55 family RecA-like ATPase